MTNFESRKSIFGAILFVVALSVHRGAASDSSGDPNLLKERAEELLNEDLNVTIADFTQWFKAVSRAMNNTEFREKAKQAWDVVKRDDEVSLQQLVLAMDFAQIVEDLTLLETINNKTKPTGRQEFPAKDMILGLNFTQLAYNLAMMFMTDSGDSLPTLDLGLEKYLDLKK